MGQQKEKNRTFGVPSQKGEKKTFWGPQAPQQGFKTL